MLAACGGDDDGASAAGPCVAATAVAADVDVDGTAITIAALDDRFEPRCVRVPAGEITVVVRNGGKHPHNLTLPNGESVAVDAGQVAILDAVLDADTSYVCTIHPGMDGTLRITP